MGAMGMKLIPLLASNTVGPLVLLLFLGPIVLGLLGLMFMRLVRARGRRRGIGFVLGLACTIVGALVLLFLITVRGGAPRFFYVAAALPLLCGIRILQIWSRTNPP